MKASRFLRAVCAVGIVSACFFALAACTTPSEEQKTENEVTGLTGGVAATVNGTEIMEDTVTTWIQNYRKTNSLTEQDAWGQWLADGGYTPETIREDIVNYYVGQDLIKQAAEENGITVESSEIDGYVDKMKGYYDSEEKWQEALVISGKTENVYRSDIEIALLEQKVKDVVAAPEEPTDEELLEYAQMYATAYDGAKRSSHILFDTTDEATAQEVLAKINANEIDFAEAAEEYSKDTASAEKGGDVGWDKLTSFVQEYTDALAKLEKDQVSEPVASTYGIHIIKCTDMFTAPETVEDANQIPSEFLDTIKSSLDATKKNDAFNAWYTDYKEAAEIVINPMPENVPYNVDMTNYKAAESTDGTTSDDSTASGGAAEGTEGASGTDGAVADEATGAGDMGTDGSASTEGQPNESNDSAADTSDPTTSQPAESK